MFIFLLSLLCFNYISGINFDKYTIKTSQIKKTNNIITEEYTPMIYNIFIKIVENSSKNVFIDSFKSFIFIFFIPLFLLNKFRRNKSITTKNPKEIYNAFFHIFSITFTKIKI